MLRSFHKLLVLFSCCHQRRVKLTSDDSGQILHEKMELSLMASTIIELYIVLKFLKNGVVLRENHHREQEMTTWN